MRPEKALKIDEVIQFVIRVTYSWTPDDKRGFETMVLVGQSRPGGIACLSRNDRQDAYPTKAVRLLEEVSGMKLSKLLIYLSILAALAAYVYFVEIRHKQEQQVIEEKAAKIVHLEKDKIVEIELLSRDKEKIELKKPSDTWVLTSPVKTKADESAVASLLHSITDAKPEKVVSEKDVKWEDYELDKPEFAVALGTKDQTAEVRFGSANPAKTSYYVRVDKQPKLLLVADTLKKQP